MNNDKQLLRERARQIAQKAAPAIQTAGSDHMLIEFVLFPERYAIEARYVREVFTLKEITPLPGTPDYVMGVINFRGEIISVVNLKILFSLREKGLTEMNKVILLRNEKMEFGLVADAITGTVEVQKHQLSEPPATLSSTGADFISGVMENGNIVLNAERLLSSQLLIVNQ